MARKKDRPPQIKVKGEGKKRLGFGNAKYPKG